MISFWSETEQLAAGLLNAANYVVETRRSVKYPRFYGQVKKGTGANYG